MKPHVKWDEVNLRAIEEEKPVRSKIDEPKTPYHPMVEGDGSVSPVSNYVGFGSYTAHAEAIRSALDELLNSSENQKHPADFSDGTSDEDVAIDIANDEEGRQSTSFEDHRKRHYDEFQGVKERQQQKGFFSDDEDEDEDEEENPSSPSIGMREVPIDGDDEILRTISIQGSEGTSPPRPTLANHP